jgi:hypothetical protein
MTTLPTLPTRSHIEAAIETERRLQRDLRRRLWREMTLLYPIAAVAFTAGIFLSLVAAWVLNII